MSNPKKVHFNSDSETFHYFFTFSCEQPWGNFNKAHLHDFGHILFLDDKRVNYEISIIWIAFYFPHFVTYVRQGVWKDTFLKLTSWYSVQSTDFVLREDCKSIVWTVFSS